MPSQTIKVAFRGQLRSFTLPVEETAKLTWAAFENRIRAVHGIPAGTEVSVSYLDVDGDRISINTDIELADLLHYHATSGTVKSLRFELNVSDASQASAGASDRGAFVFVGDGTTVADATPVEAVPNTSSASPEASATTAAGEEATPPTPGASAKGKNPAAGESDGAGGAGPSAGPSSSAGPSHPFQSFFENIRPHLAELKEEFVKSNMGPTMEKIAKEAKESLEPALKEAFESARQQSDFGPFAFGPGFQRGCGGGFSHPWANWRNSQAGSDGWSFGRRGQAGPLADPAERVWVGVVCDGCGESGFHGARYRCEDCRDFDLCQACRDGEAGAAHARFGPPGRPHDRLRRMQLPDDATEDDAIAALLEMGFPDNGVVRDLVRRYGGSVERVVELLAREQAQQFDAPSPSVNA
ncbi:hypothetical protein HK405_012018 [Cladochytrium tenue]|nr:hypothetical protein HK405_012018 [Cladochytrium tenue]